MKKIRLQMQEIRPDVPLSKEELPEGHSLNDMRVNYGKDGILNLLKNAKPDKAGIGLQIVNGNEISFTGTAGVFYVVGNMPMDLENLRVSLQIVAHTTQKKHRLKINLFDFDSVQSQCEELSEKQGFDFQELETDFLQLTDLLKQHREELFEAERNSVTENNQDNLTNLSMLTISEVAVKLKLTNGEATKKWLEKRGIQIHKFSKQNLVYEIEVICEIDKPFVKGLKLKYPLKWKNIYRRIVKDYNVYELLILQLEGECDYVPTTKVKRNKNDEKLYNDLIQ
ncbi:hypothetical protein [Flavobacterium sp. WC2509]|uniref:hypothetical protein n=1 Tax=Flavobacterium sp. WC2509 TaxID=3461406 RepID=UPI0040444F75